MRKKEDSANPLEKYGECMEEIKKRTHVVHALLSGACTVVYRQTTVESIILQIRKILELIAMASMSANKELYARQRQNFNKDWHAKLILADIEKVNPDFYPIATKQVLDSLGKRVVATTPVESGYLTRTEFENIYDHCGRLLHAANPFAQTKSFEGIMKVLPKWINKITTLLNHHQVQLADSRQQIWVSMQTEQSGNVQVMLFEQVSPLT